MTRRGNGSACRAGGAALSFCSKKMLVLLLSHIILYHFDIFVNIVRKKEDKRYGGLLPPRPHDFAAPVLFRGGILQKGCRNCENCEKGWRMLAGGGERSEAGAVRPELRCKFGAPALWKRVPLVFQNHPLMTFFIEESSSSYSASAGTSGCAAAMLSGARKRKPAFDASIIARSLKESPAAMVS